MGNWHWKHHPRGHPADRVAAAVIRLSRERCLFPKDVRNIVFALLSCVHSDSPSARSLWEKRVFKKVSLRGMYRGTPLLTEAIDPTGEVFSWLLAQRNPKTDKGQATLLCNVLAKICKEKGRG